MLAAVVWLLARAVAAGEVDRAILELATAVVDVVDTSVDVVVPARLSDIRHDPAFVGAVDATLALAGQEPPLKALELLAGADRSV